MKVYEALGQAFVGEGATTIFGLMGDANIYWMSNLRKNPKVRFIEARHEGAALSMADGWARTTGKPGVCTVTSGPGLAQLANSMLIASRARTPAVIFAGDTPEGVFSNSQHLNQQRFAEAAECGYVRLVGAGGAHQAVRKAFNQAKNESRPVVLSVPMDTQLLEHDGADEYEPSSAFYPTPRRPRPDPELLAEAAQIIASSKKPVIIAGKGALASDAGKAIVSLGNRIGALLATSLLAKTYLAENDFHAGIAGLFAPLGTTELYTDADCVIGVGASLNSHTLESGYLFPNARFIHLDTAPQVVMGTGRTAECYVRGDARLSVEGIDAILAEKKFSSTGYRTAETKEKLNGPVDATQYEIAPGTLDPRRVSEIMDEVLPGEIGFVLATGHFFSFPAMHMKKPRPLAMTSVGFGSVGNGIGTGIGAAIALGKPLLVIEGDGGFMMHCQELDTLRRYNIPVMVVVMNDEALGAEFHKSRAHHIDPEPSRFTSPDLATVAKGMGCRGTLATSDDGLRAALAEFVANPAPSLIDARISRNVISIPYRRMHFGEEA